MAEEDHGEEPASDMSSLVQEYVSARHMSLQEAAKLIDEWTKKHPDETPQLIDKIAQMGEGLKVFPEEVQKAIITTVGPSLVRDQPSGKDDTFQELTLKVAALKSLTSDDSATRKEIEELKEQMSKLIQEKQTNEVTAQINDLKSQIAALEEKLVTAAAPPPPPASVASVDPAEALVQQFQKTEEMKKTLQQVFGVAEQPDEAELAEKLRQRGWRVEGPTDLEAVERQWEAKLEEMRAEMEKEKERVKKQTEEEIKKQIDREGMFLQFAQNMIGTVLENLTAPEKANVANFVKGALTAFRTARAAQGTVATTAPGAEAAAEAATEASNAGS
jgi:hypothetical protein